MISVVITTHNRVAELKKAISSVRNQTYKDIEIIVVDDCSDDGTREYCMNCKDINYVYISPERHKNGNYARNLGAKMANGEYIAFLDDDDLWMPAKLEKQKKAIENGSFGMVYTARKFNVNNGARQFDEKIDEHLKGNLRKQIFYNIISTTSCIMVKRSVLESIGYFDEDLEYWQEYDLLIRICAKVNVALVNEPLVLYSVNYSDAQRLSNKIDGFKKAVAYINGKYKNQINNLNKNEKAKRKAMIYNDVASRYDSIGKHNIARAYLWKTFITTGKLKDLVRWMLCYTTFRKMVG